MMLIELSPSGGLFHFVFQLGTHLARQGHQVEIMTGPDPELTAQEPGLTISSSLPTWHAASSQPEPTWLRRPRRVVRAFRHIWSLILVVRRVRRDRPDAVFFQPLRFPLDAWAVRACRLVSPDTRRCLVLHETRPLNERRRGGSMYREDRVVDQALQRALTHALRAMDVIFVLGESARAAALDHWAPSCPVVVIPHGNEDIFLTEADIPPVESTDPVALFFGIWTRHKGIDVLLEAFAEVRRAVPQARLIVAGAVQGDVDLAAIRRRADEIPGVELRPGYVAMDAVPTLFGQARVVVAPYLRANQSGVVHLAQTFGRPVIATDVGDIPTVVPTGEAGLIIPPNDVPALATALEKLLTNPSSAAGMGLEGRRRLSRESSWGAIASTVSEQVARAGR